MEKLSNLLNVPVNPIKDDETVCDWRLNNIQTRVLILFITEKNDWK